MQEALFPREPPGKGPDWRSRFATARSSIDGPPEWRYELAIPRTWRLENALYGDSRGFRSVARFVPSEGLDAEVLVSVGCYRRDVNPADWLDISWDLAGGVVVRRRDWPTPAGIMADVLVRHTVAGRPSLWRGTILKDRDRLFRVEARAAEEIYPGLAQDLFVSVASFRLLHPEGRPTAEPLFESSHDAPVVVRFQRLASWDAAPPKADNCGCELQVTTHDLGVEVGRITVEVRTPLTGRTPYRLAQECAEHLKNRGFQLRGAPVLPVEPPAGFLAAAIYAPTARHEGREFDSPILLLQHAEALVALSLLGPARRESPEWWAINKRAFEIVRDSLVIGRPDAAADVPQQAGPSHVTGGEAAG